MTEAGRGLKKFKFFRDIIYERPLMTSLMKHNTLHKSVNSVKELTTESNFPISNSFAFPNQI